MSYSECFAGLLKSQTITTVLRPNLRLNIFSIALWQFRKRPCIRSNRECELDFVQDQSLDRQNNVRQCIITILPEGVKLNRWKLCEFHPLHFLTRHQAVFRNSSSVGHRSSSFWSLLVPLHASDLSIRFTGRRTSRDYPKEPDVWFVWSKFGIGREFATFFGIKPFYSFHESEITSLIRSRNWNLGLYISLQS